MITLHMLPINFGDRFLFLSLYVFGILLIDFLGESMNLLILTVLICTSDRI